MTKYYTGVGDDGSTGIVGKGRVGKDSRIIQAVGEIDELNSVVGVAIANTPDSYINKMLKVVQDRLFVIGAEISSTGGTKLKSNIDAYAVTDLEKQIDEIGTTLPELKKFVLPGGSLSSSYLHLARSVSRRAERSVVALSKETKINPSVLRYLNRLSSFFFAAALYVNKKEGIEEFNPTYG